MAITRAVVFVGLVVAAIAVLTKAKRDQVEAREAGAWYYAARSHGTSDRALAAAIEDNDYDEVRRRLGTKPRDDVRRSILLRLAMDSRAEALRAFLDSGWDPNGDENIGRPIGWASKMNQTKALKVLLDKGADPNLPDADGTTPLVTCCGVPGTKKEVVEMLLAHGADVSLKARSLLVGGGPPNRSNQPRGVAPSIAVFGPNSPQYAVGSFLSPLDAAIFIKRSDLVRLLLRHGAKFDPKRYEVSLVRFASGIDHQYNTMKADNREVVALLLELGVDVNAVGPFYVPGKDEDKTVACTALYAARSVGNKPMVELLLKHGANPNAKAEDFVVPDLPRGKTSGLEVSRASRP